MTNEQHKALTMFSLQLACASFAVAAAAAEQTRRQTEVMEKMTEGFQAWTKADQECVRLVRQAMQEMATHEQDI